MKEDLSVSEVARIAQCHVNTVRSYERKGLIQATRNLHGFRRFMPSEALVLKGMLSLRRTGK